MSEKYLAAIDLGTNSFHIIIVKVRNDGSFESICKEKESVRLGSGTGQLEIITPDAIERGLKCLKRFKALADMHNAKIRAIATSALREAKNRDTFIEKAQKECGIHVEVIRGNEEARLIYFGILQGLPVFDKKIMLVDIGGGSTEILIGHKSEIIFSTSMKIGAIRLTDKFFNGDPDHQSDIKECKLYVEGMLSPIKRDVDKQEVDIIIGSSGTIQSIAQMIIADNKEPEPRALNGFEFTNNELTRIRKILTDADTLKKRTKIPGLDPRRADIIVAGSIILEEIFHKFKINTMTVSDYALREGIIYDTIKKWKGQEFPDPHYQLNNIRYKAVNNLANNFPYEKEHVKHVTTLALKIFDSLKTLHKMSNEEKELLEAAAMLHEIGVGISVSSHHKHSYYIIRNSELMVGFNFEEIEIIALIARYHRKSPPKPKHIEFHQLNAENQNIVKKLAGILRIADGLDRSHQSIIEDVTCDIQGNIAIIRAKVRDGIDPHVEVWSAQQKKDLFEEAFGIQCVFVTI